MDTQIKHGEARTDALRPAVFDPADFEVTAWFDLKEFEEGGFAGHIRDWEQEIVETFGERGRAFVEDDSRYPGNPLWVCDHCGASNLRYVGAVRQISTGAIFAFGNTCSERAGLVDRAEFDLVQLRNERANRRAREIAREKAAHFLNDNEDIRRFLLSIERGDKGEARDSFDFVNSLDGALNKYGELTPKQAAGLRKVMVRRAEVDAEGKTMEQKIAEREAAKGPAPSGRQTLVGEVVSVKAQDGYMHGSTEFKMVVRFENDSAAWVTVPAPIFDRYVSWQHELYLADVEAHTAWATRAREAFTAHIEAGIESIPEAGRDAYRAAFESMPLGEIVKIVKDEEPEPERRPSTLADYLVGRKVELTATFTVSDRDEHFAFGKRPIATLIDQEA